MRAPNAKVAAAYMPERGGTEGTGTLGPGGGVDVDVDDVLDDVEDNRIETRELAVGLGSLGGIDDPLDEKGV